MVPDPILDRLATLHPKIIDLSLDRLLDLLTRLDHPQRRLPPVIHVAGTNGKGSTIAMLRAIHQAAGRRVHAYTSPHLVRFAERFIVAGAEISGTALAEILLDCERANAGRTITLFEITSAAGMLAFSRTPADLLLLEVGLGGRFDATNVVDTPALSVITPVSMDHQHYLGDTIEAIAFEKAGILKPGVPAVIGRQPDAALDVIMARAAEIQAPLAVHGRDWSVGEAGGGLVFEMAGNTRRLPRPLLPGPHQIDNAGIALAAVERLNDVFPVSESVAANGLSNAKWPARLQHLTHGPMLEGLAPETAVWLDGGHNADAGRVIAETVRGWRQAAPDRTVHLIFGTLNTRDPADYLSPFRGLVGLLRTVAIPGEANSLSAADAADAGSRAGLNAMPAGSTADAVRDIIKRTSGPRTILICGSLYLAGTVLREHG